MTKKLKWFLTIGVVVCVVVTLFAVACGSPKPTATTNNNTTTPVGKVIPKGSAVVVVGDLATQPIDPHFGLGGNSWLNIWALNASLLNTDPTTQKLEPWLAASWEVGPDSLTWTFHLRKDLKFHSGNPVTAHDFEYSFKKVTVDGKAAPTVISSCKAMYENIWAADDYTLMVKTKAPNVTLLYEQAQGKSFFDVPTAIDSKYINEVGYDEFIKHPSLTGPYKFVDQKLGEYLKLEAFDDLQPKAPYVKSLTYTVAPEATTRLAMLKTGAADVMIDVSGASIPEAKTSPGIKVLSFSPGYVADLVITECYFPNEPSPLLDKRVRQAMAYAIDRQAIVDKLFYGEATVQTLPTCMPTVLGYDPAVKGYTYDPEKAKALLKEAGYPNGFKYVNYARPAWMDMGQAIAGYWKDIGIDCEVRPIDGAIFLRDEPAKALRGCFNTYAPVVPADLAVRLAEYYRPAAAGGGPWSFCSDSSIGGKVDDILSTMDQTTRVAKMKSLLAIIADELPSRIPTIAPNRVMAIGPRVEIAVPGLTGGFQYPNYLKLKD